MIQLFSFISIKFLLTLNIIKSCNEIDSDELNENIKEMLRVEKEMKV